MFDVKVDATAMARWAADLGEARKHLPYVLALGLTRTAQQVRAEEREEMKRVFDRPTPYTLNSLYLRAARKDRLEAEVWLKDSFGKGQPATKFLGPQVFGGRRTQKRSERRLGYFITLPGGGYGPQLRKVKLDKYGNVQRGELQRILSQLDAYGDTGQNAKASRRKRYFAVRPGSNRKGQHLKPGIYRRDGNRLGLMFVITKSAPTYRPIFAFHAVAQRVVDRRLPYNLGLALQEALATAA